MSEEPQAEPGAKPEKKGRGRLLVIVGLAVLLLGGGGAAAYFMLLMPSDSSAATAPDEEPGTDPAEVVFVELPEMLVNLNVTGRRLRFLKIAMALEVEGEEQAAAVRQFVPRILDSFHVYLRAIRPEELQGAEGVYRIKEELLVRTNDAIRPAEVRDVLISEMLVQ